MINNLPKPLIEAAEEHLIKESFLKYGYDPFNHFFFDCVIESVVDNLDILNESLDSDLSGMIDSTEMAYQQYPQLKNYNKENNITDFKVEFHPPTNQVFTTFRKNGSWEIHHQAGYNHGKKINSPNPPMRFVSHVHKCVKEKIGKGEKVRISAPEELIHSYHKLSSAFSEKNDNIGITHIEDGYDERRPDIKLKEFTIYPKSMHESPDPTRPFNKLITEHMWNRWVKDNFGMTDSVKLYEEKMRKQGHVL